MKKILFVNGSYNEIPLIKAAHELGMYVITSGNDQHGEGHKYANEYCSCDYSNKEAIYRLAKIKKVDAICSCGNDLGAISAAYACDKLGLPGHDCFENACMLHEKDKFKELVRELNLSSPKSFPFSNINKAIEHLKNVSFPQIVKPVDLGGGKGISIVNSYEAGKNAIIQAFNKSKNKHIVIEDYIEGKQQGVTCYIHNGKVVFDYSTDDFSYLNPYMVAFCFGPRCVEYAKIRDKIIMDVELIANYRKLHNGMLTIQFILKDGKPYYIETMRRCLGNMHYLCMSKDYGINFYKLFVANEAGLDCEELIANIKWRGTFSGFVGLYAPKNGVIKSIDIDQNFSKTVFDSYMLYGPGYEVRDYLNDKIGNLFFSFNSEYEKCLFMNKTKEIFSMTMEE